MGFICWLRWRQLPQLGFVTLVAGFCYLDLVLWSLGACLMKNMGLPATWVAELSGAALFSGVLVGGAVAYVVLGGRPYGEAAILASFAACFLFACALFLSSGRNLKYGWGTVLPGEGGLEAGDLAGIMRAVRGYRACGDAARDRGDAAACSGKPVACHLRRTHRVARSVRPTYAPSIASWMCTLNKNSSIES